MKHLIQWLRNVRHWLRRVPITRHYWWAFALVLASFGGIWLFGRDEKVFRYAGTLLQLAGVWTVVVGILKTRSDFKLEPVWSLFKKWAKQFPPFRQKHVLVGANVVLPSLSGRGYMTTTHGPSVDQTFEGRLGHLEMIVKKLETAQGKTHVAVLQAEEKAQRALDELTHQLEGQIGAVEKQIEKTATSGVHVSAMGVIWLFFGTVFAGFAHELACLLAR